MVRRQALLRDGTARRSGSLPDGANLDPVASGTSGASRLGSGSDAATSGAPGSPGSRRSSTSDDAAEGTGGPGQPGPYANRLIVLTKRLEVGFLTFDAPCRDLTLPAHAA